MTLCCKDLLILGTDNNSTNNIKSYSSKTHILYLRVKISESEVMQCFAKIFVFNTFTQATSPRPSRAKGCKVKFGRYRVLLSESGDISQLMFPIISDIQS